MQNDIFKFFEEASQNAINSANELVALNTRVLNSAIERQVELANVCIEGSKKQADLIGSTKDPKELMEKQTKLTEQYTAILVEATKENVSIAQKTSEEYKTWFDGNVAKAEKTTQKVTPKKKVA